MPSDCASSWNVWGDARDGDGTPSGGSGRVNIVVTAKGEAHGFECAVGENILYAGLRSGLELPYECGTGTCGTCKARLGSGETVSAWPEAPGYTGLKTDDILMCQTLPGGDCALEVRNAVTRMPSDACVPGHLGAIIRRRQTLTHDVATLELELERPIDFEAGQFVVMTAPGISGGRAYSMVNYDRPATRLLFVVKAKPGGRFSEWFFGDGVEGTRVHLFGPLGHATFHPDVQKDLLCIAGGSGIAGMMAILSRACQDRHFEAFEGHLFFGVRTARDLFFLDELRAFTTTCPGRMHVTLALSEEDVDAGLAAAHPEFAFDRGFVHAVAGAHMKGKFANVRAYAAGPPPMVSATLRMLLLEGKLKSADIRYDKFS
jgi:toluene monooxygenase electron transfer component